MKRVLFALSFISLFLAACAAPAAPVVVEVTPTPVVPTPTHIPVDVPPAQRAVIAALAAQLGIPADSITLLSSEGVTWNDGCLGVVHMGMMCLQGQVQGFRITLQANGATYEFHTNQDGSVLVDATGTPNGATQAAAGTPTTEPTGNPTVEPTHVPVDTPVGAPVQRAAIAAAIKTLGLPDDQVMLVSIEAVDWPNGCLGVTRIGVMCTQMVVPGFRIVLAANGKHYEFHTNLDASEVAPANGPAVEVPEAIVAIVKPMLAAALGVADSSIQVVSTQIIEWPDGCLGVSTPGLACSQIVTPGYLVTLQANGQQYEYHTNGDASSVAPASLALSWQRTGGIAGFNDNLVVYASGEIHAGWNSGSRDSQLSALTADQQAQLQSWLAKFGSVSVQHSDPANASDQMSTSFTLLGGGSGQPSAVEQQAMLDWAQNVLSGLEK